MSERSHSWPEGHWDWYRHLAFKHGVRCGRMIFVGGQVDKTPSGEPRNAGDLAAQTGVVVGHVARVLEEFGAGLADVTRLVAFYATDGDVHEPTLVADIGRHVLAQGGAADGAGPVIVPVPLPWLALPGMRIEIEAVAMLGGAGERLPKRVASPPGSAALPAPFVHGVRCEEHVWTGAQTGGADAGQAFERMNAVLAALDASPADLVRVGAWYASGAPSAGLARHMDALAATSVVLPTSRLPGGEGLRIDGWAMGGAAGAPLAREVSDRADDWRWPDRKTRTMAVGCGDMVFVSGQMPLDETGAAVNRADLNAQTRLCLKRTGEALAAFGLALDDMVKQTTFFRGDADPADIVANQTLRSGSFREPAGASTGVPLADCGIDGALVSIDTIAMR